MMKKLELPPVTGYDPEAQSIVAYLAAALDDQLRDCLEVTRSLTLEQLEWQLAPGQNTVGMLLAHLAVVEVAWLQVAAAGKDYDESTVGLIKEIIGIVPQDDGLPLAPDGTHPASLAGRTSADYRRMLEAARAATHTTLRGWPDASLSTTYTARGHEFSRAWILYHVLEHFAQHLGQIRLLRRHVQRP